jgi:hypothetical protein
VNVKLKTSCPPIIKKNGKKVHIRVFREAKPIRYVKVFRKTDINIDTHI